MAKSARSNARQKNNTALRNNVFGPVEQARARRLSEKLSQVVSQPTEREKQKQNEMEVERTHEESDKINPTTDAMEVDDQASKTSHTKPSNKRPSRVQKKRRGKPHSQITFPQLKKRALLKKKCSKR
ncbi:MAG: hypothetical protein Q9162_007787 [Coniocarpon cinnabarinum]